MGKNDKAPSAPESTPPRAAPPAAPPATAVEMPASAPAPALPPTEEIELLRAQRDAAAAQRDALLLETVRLREALDTSRAELEQATGRSASPVEIAYAVLIVDGEVPLHLERAVCQLGPITTVTMYRDRPEGTPADAREEVRCMEFRAVDSSADAALPLAQTLLTAALPGVSMRIEQRQLTPSRP
jgi:hypothetical protein